MQSTDNLSLSNTLKLSNKSNDDIKQATLNLLSTIRSACSKLQKIPDNLYMTMRLQYFEETTPMDYIPPGFKSADNITFRFDGNPINIRIGNVQTVCDILKISNASLSIKMNIQTNSEFLSNLKEISSKIGSGNELSQQSVDLDEKMSCERISSNNVTEDELSISLQQQSLQSETDHSEVYDVRCPCGVNKDDGVMILCDGCGMWQHAVCFRILEENDVPSSHICELCCVSKVSAVH
ncbi:HORMA domain-containing protein 2 [Fasciolopsis buskii]|uniref:HORMA domain-containing protein 2 n=1 Tax=Fasciolopsis buskii TaxID=27845 RepID=A0A8E0VEX6_9TREM|nr:HORMA domain-containing protein 2 [Fasciolopsis buski]